MVGRCRTVPATPAFDGTSYAQATGHHRAFDDSVLDGLALAPGMRVLDLGCGVGDLTRDVADRVRTGSGGAWVLGVDASASCVAVASRLARPGLSFVAARAQDLSRFLGHETVDAVLSVATLHWVPEDEQPGVLSGVVAALRRGGRLRVDLGGNGQIARVREVLAPLATDAGIPTCPWFFPTPARMGALVVEAGLVVEEVASVHQRRSVPDAPALATWLVSQVLPAYLAHVPQADHDRFAAEAVRLCRSATRRDDGSFDQDYVRIHLTAVKRPRPVGGMPAAYGLVADLLASITSQIAVSMMDDRRKALLSKRLRRISGAARNDPVAAVEPLAALRTELRRPLG